MERKFKNTFCVQYWKPQFPSEVNVLRSIDADGNPVSTKKYSEVTFYDSLADAMPDARHLLENGYDIKIRKCCKARNDSFWLM